MDFHCDGKVNYSEFLAATISTINFNKEEKLWSAFKYFDTTDSGYITLDSVMDALKDSGVIIDEEGLKETFNELQKKGKKINFNEFKAIALGKDVVEEEHEYSKDIKENEQDFKRKQNLKLLLTTKNNDDESDKEDKIRKVETAFIKEEKKESQDIFFEKVNFSTNNINYDNIDIDVDNKEKIDNTENKENRENKENKENNANSVNRTENKENDNKDENNKNEKKFEKKNEDNMVDTSNNNANNSNKNHTKSNNKSSKSHSKSNNKSSKSINKSSKSYNKSSKSNNKSSKSNMEVLIEEHSIDNNDRFTEVNENQD